MHFKLLIVLVAAISIFLSCDSKPKVIVEDTTTSTTNENNSSSGALNNPNMQVGNNNNIGSGGSDFHQVVALETLQAEKYTYLKVLENNKDTFWIATSKLEDAKKGKQYFYRGGLMKTNFESKEHNRVFDKIYLVSNIIDATQHPGGQMQGQPSTGSNPQAVVASKDVVKAKGSIALDELFKNKSKYKDQSIIVSGKVVKANMGIMGRNWFHIQDGSKIANKACDLTITTQDVAQIGNNVNFRGKITLDKDFGSGYRYDVLMEEAKSE